MKSKSHLTEEGLELIKEIKNGMNRSRIIAKNSADDK